MRDVLLRRGPALLILKFAYSRLRVSAGANQPAAADRSRARNQLSRRGYASAANTPASIDKLAVIQKLPPTANTIAAISSGIAENINPSVAETAHLLTAAAPDPIPAVLPRSRNVNRAVSSLSCSLEIAGANTSVATRHSSAATNANTKVSQAGVFGTRPAAPSDMSTPIITAIAATANQ